MNRSSKYIEADSPTTWCPLKIDFRVQLFNIKFKLNISNIVTKSLTKWQTTLELPIYYLAR